MKKLFCILLALVMLLCLAACGDDEDSGRKKKDKDKVTSSAVDKREKVEDIGNGTAFSDGVAVVTFNEVKKNKYITRCVVIDKEGYIVGEFDNEDGSFYIRDDMLYKNGVMVLEDVVYDKTGKIIASPEKTGYTRLLTDARVDGKILAVKIEENYDGDTLYFGILNNTGKWEEPLSASHPITVLLEQNDAVTTDLSFNNFYSDEVVRIANDCYYNVRTGTVTKMFNNLVNQYRTVYNSDGHYDGYTYDICLETGEEETTLVVENMYLDSSFASGFIAHRYEKGHVYDSYYYYDLSGNLIAELDIADFYDVKYADGHIVIKHRNSTGSEYVSVYNTEGTKITGPFRTDSSIYGCRVWADYGVIYLDYSYYNFDGEKIEFNKYEEISCFGEGLFLARDNDWNNSYIDLKGKEVLK